MPKNHSEIFKIDGVGVNLLRFHPCTAEEKNVIRAALGYAEKDFIITVVAELNRNKNQIMLVKAVPELRQTIPELKVLLIGKETLPDVREFAEKERLGGTVQFLGYRHDVDLLTMTSDIAFSASLREELPVNIIEAMACGIPVVCSNNRGHRSLVHDKETGFMPEVGERNDGRDCPALQESCAAGRNGKAERERGEEVCGRHRRGKDGGDLR